MSDTAADMETLVDMGVVPEQPVPSDDPFLEPVYPDDLPDDAA
ncbi:hypothetical protein [Streptomyces sp. NBC_00932]|nr:hypothetical protein OG221_27910 [Streptomyces sp. NBC_00932]